MPLPPSPEAKLCEGTGEYPMYDLDELDLNWLTAVNQKRKFRGICNACVCVCCGWLVDC